MATLAEIRAKYPQYQDLSDQQLANALYQKFYSDIPRAEFDKKLGITAPSEMKPGSKEYADWAVQQVRAGKPVPQVSPPPPGMAEPQRDLATTVTDNIAAGGFNLVNGIPIAGPWLGDKLQEGKAAFQGVPVEQVRADTQKLLEDNPIGATAGTVAGVVAPFMVGGAIPGVSRLLGMSGSLGSRIALGGASGGLISAADTAARGGTTQEDATSGMLGAGIGAALPLAGRVLGTAANRLLGRTVPKGVRNISRALKDDQVAPSDINARLGAMGPEATVMDLGPNLQRQAGAVASVPGTGQKIIRDVVAGRTKNAADRVTGDIAATLGTGPELATLKEQVITAQKAAATPLYDAVRDIKVPLASGNFHFVFSTPMGKRALEAAREMAANDGYRGVDTIQIIDYAKQALDDIAKAASRKGEDNVARQAGNLAKILRTEADKVAPQYKAARDAFAGHAAVIDAMDEGAAVFAKETTPGQLKTSLAAMSKSERDAFLQAARSAVESLVGNSTNNALQIRNLLRKPYNESKLRLMLGDKITDDLLQRIDREYLFGQTAHVVAGNSETAARQAAQAEVAPELGRVPRPDGIIGLLLQAFDAARAGARGVLQPKVNASMADMLTSGQLTPLQIAQLKRAGNLPMPSIIAPASGGLLTGPNKPLEITINGGGR